MPLNHGFRWLLVMVGCAGSVLRASGPFVLSQDGLTVYDSANNITWLANANLPAMNRFGLPLCNSSQIGQQICVNASGSMNYNAAAAWVAAMNAANYLGHSDWQLPTTPVTDKNCGKVGPSGESFGFGCTAGALDSLYNALGFKSPNTGVAIPPNTTGPFSNIQPYLYWSQSSAGPSQGNSTFSFATGWQGANTLPNFLYIWPMIPAKLPGAGGSGNGLVIGGDQQTVYDPAANATWLANANIAASNTFGLPRCTDPVTPAICVAADGAMTYASAVQFIAAMNAAVYLGQKNWQLPTIAAACPGYGCAGTQNPMGDVFSQLGLSTGSPVTAPNVSTGPFYNLQPYLYWTCGGASIASPCSADGPVANQEWSYSFGSGFQGTDLLANSLFVTAYFVGNRSSAPAQSPNPCQTAAAVSTLDGAVASQAAIVYDSNQSVCWMANANLAGDANMRSALGVSGVNPNGSMDYATALKWVSALNAFNNGSGYLGHNNWQLPVAPLQDSTCADTGAQGGSFGPQCNGSAMGNLYYTGLKQSFPASVAPGFGAAVGPLYGIKASYYWAVQNNGGAAGNPTGGQEMFSFANGIQGGTTTKDSFYYVLPMIAGPIGTPPACAPSSTAVVPYTNGVAAGNAVYDCNTKYTWAANANLAASNNFGIAGNSTITYASRTISVPLIGGGAMLFDTATRFIQAMNAQQFLGSQAWQMPASSQVFEQFFADLNMASGDSRMMAGGNFGPFQNLQPFFYWGCQRDQTGNSQSPCTGYAPPDGSSQLQWTFDFDYGFQSTSALVQKYFVMVYYPVTAAPAPAITSVANAAGGSLTIAPNTWISIYGSNLAPMGDSRTWQTPDFVAGQMPAQLDGVSATVNGKSAYVSYISPSQINILTPPDAMSGPVQVVVDNNGASTAAFTAQAQPLSPSFFLLGGGPYVAAVHADGTLVGPAGLYPGSSTPAKPGETVMVYANGFGPTSTAVASGSMTQSGGLSPVPQVTIGGSSASLQFAGLVSPGLFQFNVVVPANASAGDQSIGATYNGAATPSGALITVQR